MVVHYVEENRLLFNPARKSIRISETYRLVRVRMI